MALPLPHMKLSCVSLHTKFSPSNLIYSPAIHSLVHCWVCWAPAVEHAVVRSAAEVLSKIGLDATLWTNADVCNLLCSFYCSACGKTLKRAHTRPRGSMRPRKLRLLRGSTSMDIIGLKHKSTNQIKRLTHSPCDER